MNEETKYPPFISIEGVDKAGKSTLIDLIHKYQHTINWPLHRMFFTREPGGKDNLKAEKLRNFILGNEFDVITQTYLFAAARYEHVVHTIKPQLSLGNIVITDRYIDSSLVYQGLVGELGIEKVLEINKYALQDLLPDITIVLVVSPEISIQRMQNLNDLKEINVYDQTVYLQNAQKIYDGFLMLKKYFPKRVHLIDGTKEPKQVLLDVISIINDYIDQNY